MCGFYAGRGRAVHGKGGLAQACGGHEGGGFGGEEAFFCCAFHGDAAHFKEHGGGERRDAGQFDVVDAVLYAHHHFADAAEVDETAQGFGFGDAQQQMIRVIFVQRVVEDIGAKGGLAPVLALARRIAFDEAGDCGGGAEGALDQGVAREPSLEARLERVWIEEGFGIGDRGQTPEERGVVGGDKS